MNIYESVCDKWSESFVVYFEKDSKVILLITVASG